MSRVGLRGRLGVAFALVALTTAVLSGLALSVAWQRQFEGYVRQRMQDNAEGFALSAATLYTQYGGWPSLVEARFSEGMMAGLRVQLYDKDGQKITDSAETANRRMGTTLEPAEPPSKSAAAEAPVMVYGERVGTIYVWSLAPGGMLSERDVSFRSESVKGLVLAAVLATLLASAAGMLYSRGIVRPIDQVTRTAAALRSGELEARTGMGGDDPVGVLGRTLDEMADAIEADREFERRLTADVAHELRTPLMAIQATVEAMQDGVMPADEMHLETVRNETMRLARLAESILELSRLERGAVPFAMRVLDPADPLAAALDANHALIESAGLTLVRNVEAGLLVNGDPDRLTQAFGNLLSNAARYTPSGGSTSVTLTREGDCAVVSVADTGIGIAPEDRERVFTRFWRADEARSRATGGVGVGLSVVKEIVERHGGRIAVEDVPEGGTRFSVHLPLHEPPAQPTRATGWRTLPGVPGSTGSATRRPPV